MPHYVFTFLRVISLSLSTLICRGVFGRGQMTTTSADAPSGTASLDQCTGVSIAGGTAADTMLFSCLYRQECASCSEVNVSPLSKRRLAESHGRQKCQNTCGGQVQLQQDQLKQLRAATWHQLLPQP